MADNIKKNIDATIDGNGNITVQGNEGPVTVNVGDPKLGEKLQAHGQSIEAVKQLLIMQMAGSGKMQIGLEKLLLRYPEPDDIPVLLWAGTRKFYQEICWEGGRYGHLDISDHILGFYDYTKMKTLKNQEEIPTSITPAQLLAGIWHPEGERHALLVGEEGMGKTVSLLWLWVHFLQQANRVEKKEKSDQSDLPPIPIYIALSQYNREPRHIQVKFITQYIATYYLGVRNLSPELEESLWKWLRRTPVPGEGSPKLLLLLDGLNEITADITPLLIALKENWVPIAAKGGIQILATSRYRSNHQFAEEFKVWQKQSLRPHCIRTYIKAQDLQDQIAYDSADQALRELLRNPMMLTLYVQGVKETQATSAEEPTDREFYRADLKLKVNRATELIWNFVELKLARFEKGNESDPEKSTRAHFLVKYLLPFLAYEMEKANTLEIKDEELEIVINAAFNHFYSPDFFKEVTYRKSIKRYRQHISALMLGELALVEEINRYEDLLTEFTHELYPVAKEGPSLRFLHQSFQEFFAAMHLLNEIRLSLGSGQISSLLRDAILAPHLQRNLGEMLGEHYNHPDWLAPGRALKPGEKWADFFKETLLSRVLDRCRGQFDREVLGYTVLNVLSIWKMVRGHLAGADLSELNLNGFNFNGVDCRLDGPDGNPIESRWENSRLSPSQWFPLGHSQEVHRVRISPDGRYLASGSRDCTIKIWSVLTGECLFTLHGPFGHHAWIYHLDFSPDGRRLVSGDKTGKLIEWSVADGSPLKIYRGHQGVIRGLAYHPEKPLIISTSEDGTIREWSTETGRCLHIHTKPAGPQINQCLCLLKDGELLLVGSANDPVSALYRGSGTLAGQFPKKDVRAIAGSPCGEKFVTVSIEGDTWAILEWPLEQSKETNMLLYLDEQEQDRQWTAAALREQGVVIQEFSFEKDKAPKVNFNTKFLEVTYSPTGEYLLVSGLDDNIYQWAVGQPQQPFSPIVSQTFIGHVRRTASVVYHPTQELIFSGSYDSSIKKWATTTGQVLQTFTPRLSPYNFMLEVPGSEWLFACSENGTIHRWNIAGEEPIREKIFGGDAPAYSMELYRGAEGDLLVTGGEWGVVQVWNTEGKCVRRFTGHTETVSSLSIQAETGWVVSGDMSGQLWLWSLEDPKLLEAYPLRKNTPPRSGFAAISSVEFITIQDTPCFAASYTNGEIILWSTEQQQKPIWGPVQIGDQESELEITTMHFHGAHLVSGDSVGVVREWKILSLDETSFTLSNLLEMGKENRITFVSYHDDGNKLLVGDFESNSLWEYDLIKKDSKQPLKKELSPEASIFRKADLPGRQFAGHAHYILWAIYCQDGRHLITSGQDSLLIKWDLADQKSKWTIKNIPGLKVAGLDFREVQWTEPLTDDEFELLQLYRAKLGLEIPEETKPDALPAKNDPTARQKSVDPAAGPGPFKDNDLAR